MKKIKTILQQYYGIIPSEIKPLVGFESENYMVQANEIRYVLKLYPYDQQKVNFLSAENDLLDYISTRDENKYPAVVKNLDGSGLTLVHDDSKICRVLTYLKGDLFAHVDHTPELLRSLGSFLGTMDRRLSTFHHASIRDREIHWDLNHSLVNIGSLKYIENAEIRRTVHYFFLQFRECVLPGIYALRQSIIHNDANDYNILVQDNQVTGIFDFGDIAYSSLISEVAVACAYAGISKEDPLAACCLIVEGYNRINPLEDIEVKLLYYFIAARLCTSLCESWLKRAKGEDTEYALISEKGATDLIKKWLMINPERAHRMFRARSNKTELPKRSFEKALKKRAGFMSGALSTSYSQPIYMKSAALQFMYDRKGNTFLDAYNNIMLVGHCHPKVVEAGQRMMARLNTNTRYVYDVLNDYADKLLSRFPPALSRIFFVNSGSAASDLAIRLARTYTENKKVVVLQHGYHGNTSLGIEISHYKYAHKGGKGRSDFVIEAELPDTYRGTYQDNELAGSAYAADLYEKIKNESLAAFIAEPIVGCGGQVPLAPGYLKEVYQLVQQRGGLCISDEVQVGFGRMGQKFWGYELHEVVPDIVVLGKPMGNGHPIGAVVTTEAIAEKFNNGMEFFSSFGGNPVSCAIGLAVLEVLEEEGLQEQSHTVGSYFMEQLDELAVNYPCIGDIRGSGLFIGVDIVKDPSTKEPDTQLAQHLKNELRENHILTGTDGPADNVIKIKPPLCFTKSNVDRVIETILKSLH